MSLDYVYRMTWAEFQLRLIAHNRVEKNNEYKLRRTSWINYIAPHQDPKKLKGMTEQKFWRIEGEKKYTVTESHEQKFLKETKKYLEIKNGRIKR